MRKRNVIAFLLALAMVFSNMSVISVYATDMDFIFDNIDKDLSEEPVEDSSEVEEEREVESAHQEDEKPKEVEKTKQEDEKPAVTDSIRKISLKASASVSPNPLVKIVGIKDASVFGNTSSTVFLLDDLHLTIDPELYDNDAYVGVALVKDDEVIQISSGDDLVVSEDGEYYLRLVKNDEFWDALTSVEGEENTYTDGTKEYVEVEDLELCEIMGTDQNDVVVDKEDPTVVDLKVFGSDLKDDWYTLADAAENKGLTFTVKSNSGLTKIKVMGITLPLNNTSWTYSISDILRYLKNGSNELSITGTTESGRELNYNVTILYEESDIWIGDASVSPEGTDVDGTLYLTGGNTATFEASAGESGIKKLEIEHNGEIQDVEYSVSDEGLITGTFTIESEGTYKVILTSNAGNVEEKVLLNNFKIDSSIPVIEVENEDDYSGWLKSLPKSIKFSVTTTAGLTGNPTVTVNSHPVITTSSGDGNYTSSLVGVPEHSLGRYAIKIVAKDIIGRSVDKTVVLNVDGDDPSYNNLNVSIDDLKDKAPDGKYYINSPIGISVSFDDSRSGVDESTITFDGKAYTRGTTVYIEDNNFDAEFSVSDKVGNTLVLSVKDLLAEKGINSDDIVIDVNKPVITLSEFADPAYTTTTGEKWYSVAQGFTYTVDEDHPKSVELVVNGTTVISELSKDGVYKVNLSDYTVGTDNKVEVSIKVVDWANNESSDSFTFYVDTVNPEKGNIGLTGKFSLSGGILYTNSDFTFSGEALDGESGIKSIKLYKDGEEISTGTESINETVVKDENNSGVYSIEIIDNVGNKISLDLSNLYGSDVEKIVIDTKKPEIILDVDQKDASKSGDWYTDNVDVLISVSDDNLKNFTIYRDDEEVTPSKNSDGFYVISSNMETAGNVKIRVVAEDKAGNTAEKSINFNIDKKPPTVEGLKVEVEDGAEINVYDDALYTNGGVTICGTPVDNESGIEAAELIKDGDVVSSGQDAEINYTISDVSQSGEYTLYVRDKAGNETTYAIGELFESPVKRIVVDKNPPVVSIKDIPEALNKDGTYWYSKNPEITFSAEDVEENLDQVVIKVDGSVVYDSKSSGLKSDGLYRVTPSFTGTKVGEIVLEAKDKAGNRSSVSYTLGVDSEAPEIGSIKVALKTGEDKDTVELNEVRGKLYTNGYIEFSGAPVDSGSGVYSVEILKGDKVVYPSDGVTTSLSYTLTGSNQNGEYKVRVKDWSGNSTEYSLSELLNANNIKTTSGDNVTSSYILINYDGPSIERKISDGVIAIDGIDWYAEVPTITYEVIGDLDSIYPVEIKATVNGIEKTYNLEPSEDGMLVITPEMLEMTTSGDVKIYVYVKDYAGNHIDDTYNFKVDLDKPTKGNLKTVVSEDYRVVNDILYTNGSVTISGKASDLQSGVASIEVYNVKNKTKLNNSESNTWVISENGSYGEYYITVTDKVGHSSTFGVVDLIEGLSSTKNAIEIDRTPPELTKDTVSGVKHTDSSNVDWYADNPKVVVHASDKNLNNVEIRLNGKVYINEISDDGSYTITSDVKEGSVGTFEIAGYAEDHAKNVNNTLKYNFGVDRSKPTKGSLKATHGVLNLYGDTLYTNSEIVISGTPEDTGSGVSKVELFKDGKLVQEYTGSYTIKGNGTNGTYTLVIEDKVGNKTTIGLGELLNQPTNKVVIDSGNPVVKIDEPKEWYKDDPTINVTVSDQEGNLDTDKIKTDAGSVKITSTKIDKNGKYTVTTETTGTTKVTISVTALDKAGNSGSNEISFGVDKEAPTSGSIKLEASGKSRVDSDNKLYIGIGGSLRIVGTAKDTGSGVSKVELFKDGVSVGSWANSIDYTIDAESESGKYTLQFTDAVGNISKEIGISELSGLELKSNEVVVDLKSPSIGYIKDSVTPSYGDWFADDPKTLFKIEDSNISSVKISIDGKEVVNKVSTNGSYSVKSETEGTVNSVTITAQATDKAGNTESLTYTYKIDRDRPTTSNIKVTGVGTHEYEEAIYSNGSISIAGYSEDKSSGIRSITVYKGDSVIIESKNLKDINYVIDTESKSGSYFIEATDNVGNTTGKLPLSQFLGTKTNLIKIDKTMPTLSRKDKEAALSLNGVDWFADNPTLSYNVNDTNLDSAIITVNGKQVLNVSESGEYSVNTATNSDGIVEIRYKVTDKAGNEISGLAYKYTKDTTAPSITSASISSKPVNEKGGNVYYNDQQTVSLNGTDGDASKAVGIDTYYLNGKSFTGTTITVSSDGANTLKVSDLLGNTSSETSLSTLLGWKGNNIVIDNSNPVISGTRPAGAKGDWYASDGVFNISVKDNKGIDSVVVTINGTKVNEAKFTETNKLEASLTADMSKVKANEDGSYNVKVVAIDNAKNSSEWTDTVYKDTTAPVITGFVINGSVRGDGKTINGSKDTYGFFFNGNGSIEVKVKDSAPTSGIAKIYTSFDGQNWTEHSVKNNLSEYSVTVDVPKDFRGTIYARAEDVVGNMGSTSNPDGMISETSNTHNNHVKVEITLPETQYKDSNGLPLYNADFSAGLTVGSDWSGIRSVEWGINNETIETITSFSGATYDNNIATSFTRNLKIAGNSNNMKVWVKVTDNSGYVSENSKNFSIDKDAPVISVTYNDGSNDRYYNVSRSATITVKERNFNANSFKVSGTAGSVSSWKNLGNDTWEVTMSFNDDADYNFQLTYVDQAGNNSNTYISDTFTIDKTKPTIMVSWDNTSVSNDKYYSSGRTATVVVTERNFDPSKLVLTGSASFGSWSTSGDTHTSKITFDKDGVYSFSISGQDNAKNALDMFSSGEFIVDQTSPKVVIEGITDGVSYKGNVGFIIDVEDEYVNVEKSYVTLKGKNHEERTIVGQLDLKSGHFEFDDFAETEDVDDIYTIVVNVEDMSGNVTSRELVFSVNRFGSSYEFGNPDMLGKYLNKATDIQISETNVDQLNKDQIQIIVTKDGREVVVPENLIAIYEKEVNGKFVYTYSVNKGAFSEDGTYVIQVYSKASDGTQYTSAGEQYSFVIDTTKPEILVSGVQSNGRYQDYSRAVTVDVRDLSGVDTIEVTVNGKPISITEENGVYSFGITESSSLQTLKVRVVDKAGNENVYSVNNFLITSNPWAFIVNQWWFWAIIIGVLLLILLLIFFIIKRHRDEKKDEAERRRVSEELYKSGVNSTGSSQSSTSGGSRIARGSRTTKRSTTDGGLSDIENATTGYMDVTQENVATGIIDGGLEDAKTEMLDE